MEPEKQKTAGHEKRDKIFKFFLEEHTGMPNALFGDQMEREAYLDTLVTRFKHTTKRPESGEPVVLTG